MFQMIYRSVCNTDIQRCINCIEYFNTKTLRSTTLKQHWRMYFCTFCLLNHILTVQSIHMLLNAQSPKSFLLGLICHMCMDRLAPCIIINICHDCPNKKDKAAPGTKSGWKWSSKAQISCCHDSHPSPQMNVELISIDMRGWS